MSFRHLHCDSESYGSGPDGIEYFTTEELFPGRVEGRRELADVHFIPSDVRRVYVETRRALANGQPVLAGIGIRAIIETVCREMDAKGKNLKLKISDLAGKGLLTGDGAAILQRLRSMGNLSAHKVKPHTPEQLALAMDVVEHLLQGAYIFPERTRRTLQGEA